MEMVQHKEKVIKATLVPLNTYKSMRHHPSIWHARRVEEADVLRDLMDKYVKRCIDFVLEGIADDVITMPLQQTIPLTNLNMVTQLCILLEVILVDDTTVCNPTVCIIRAQIIP